MLSRSAYSLLTLGIVAGVAFVSYGPAVAPGFPMDSESASWLRHFERSAWPAIPSLPSYHNVVPVGNIALKLAAEVYALDAQAGQALGVVLIVVCAALVGRLSMLLLDGDRMASTTAACLFAGSTSYYHLVLSPVNVCAAGVFYVLVLLALVGAVAAVRGTSPRGWMWAAGLGALLPLQFYGAPTFLPILAATLWATRVDLRPYARQIAGVAIAHLVMLAIAQAFLTGIFSTHFVEPHISDPSRFGLAAAIAAQPLEFFFVVVRNAIGAWTFGLVAPFFLLTPPSGAWAIVGIVGLAVWIAAIATWRSGLRINAALLATTLVPLLVTCVLRNPFNVEQGAGRFDLHWVVSMPRYYLFPSVGLAVSMAASLSALGARFGTRGRAVSLALVIVVLFGNVFATRTKLAILEEETRHGELLPSEVFRFTSPLVHPDHQLSERTETQPSG